MVRFNNNNSVAVIVATLCLTCARTKLNSNFYFIRSTFYAGLNESKGAWNGQKRSVLVDTFLTSKQPEFDREKQQNVSALVGKTAFLTCSVHNLKPTQKASFFFLHTS
jgi:hypothetical protein